MEIMLTNPLHPFYPAFKGGTFLFYYSTNSTYICRLGHKKFRPGSNYHQEVFNMPELKYTGREQVAAAGGQVAEKRADELEELNSDGDLYENGAYTNGLIGNMS